MTSNGTSAADAKAAANAPCDSIGRIADTDVPLFETSSCPWPPPATCNTLRDSEHVLSF
jgi:hypothetical protein